MGWAILILKHCGLIAATTRQERVNQLKYRREAGIRYC